MLYGTSYYEKLNLVFPTHFLNHHPMLPTFTSFYRSPYWLAMVLLCLLGSPGLAQGQGTSPFKVGVTPAGPLSLSNGSQTLTAQAVYPGLKVGTGFGGKVTAAYVRSLAVQSDGKILVGGNFTTYNGTPCRYVARLNTDGSFDNSFAHDSLVGLDHLVSTFAVQPNGKILVGGDFTSYGRASHQYIARLKATGGIDSSFAGTGFSSAVNTLVLQPDGKVLVGGPFAQEGNASAMHLARLDSTGNLDPTFEALFGDDANVFALALQPDGKLLVGGSFSHYAGIFSPNLIRVNPDGSPDPSFNGGIEDQVRSLVVQPDGKILVGGEFYGHVARLNADGSLDPSFTSPSLDNYVVSLALQPDGKLLVGGAFTGHLVRLTATGARDTSFGLTGTGLTSTSAPATSEVFALATQPNNQVVVGGEFTAYDSKADNRNHIARLNANGTLDDANSLLPNATYTWSNGSTGPTLTVVTSGKYVAKATAAGLTAVSDTVRVGGASSALQVRVTPTGPFSICPGASQLLTAAVLNTTEAASYTWWKADSVLSRVGKGNTYTVTKPGRYFVTGRVKSDSAASATITVRTLPTPTIAGSVSAVPGASVAVAGTNLQAVTKVSFGTLNAPFTLASPTQLMVTVPAGATSGDVTLTTSCTTVTKARGFSLPPPTLAGFTPSTALPGTSITLTGSGFVSGATTVALNGVSISPTGITVLSSTQLTAVVPTTATSGKLTVSTGGGSATSPNSFTVAFGTPLVIANTQTLFTTTTGASSQYSTLIIKAPGNVTVKRSPGSSYDYILIQDLEVQAGATLTIEGSAKVICSGTFKLAAGATLNVGHPNGLNLASPPRAGAVYLGASSPAAAFSPDASYGFIGTAAQITGNGLPTRVRNLTSRNADSLTLTRPVAVAQVLTMAGPGNLYLNNQTLTLLSGVSGTALVNNQGTGVVVGPATVQRYIDPSVNPTAGFRYYGSPVRGATAATFKAPAFTYDQSRSLNFVRQDTLPDISVGFVPTPLATSAFLEVGRGYRTAVAATDTVRFVGTLMTGNDTVNLQRSSRKSYSGWNLVSNPYPSPLNWNKVDPADRPGLEAAIYVYESTGPGAGYFRSYVYKKVGTGDSLIAAGQAFFVRVRQSAGAQASTGQLIFRNSQRVSNFDSSTQPAFNRLAQQRAPEPELTIELARNGGCRPCRPTGTTATPVEASSKATIYVNSAATLGFDPLLDADAGNLLTFSKQTISIRSGGSTRSAPATDTLAVLAVQALPPFLPTRIVKVPLTLSASAPDTYTLNVTSQNFTPLLNGARAYLRDSSATTNNWTELPTATPYSFQLSAAELLATSKPIRFWLQFGPQVVTATAASTTLQQAALYPNPAHGYFYASVPGIPGATRVRTTLLTLLGQVVLDQEAALPAAGTTLRLSVPGQASGMYLLRLQAGGTTITQRVALAN